MPTTILHSDSEPQPEIELKQHDRHDPFDDEDLYFSSLIASEAMLPQTVSSTEQSTLVTAESIASKRHDASKQSNALPDWVSLIQKLKLRGLVKQLAQQSELLVFEDKYLELRCENRALASNSMAFNGLESAINAYFSDAPKILKIQVGTVQATPAKVHAQAKEAEMVGAQAIIAQDETIQALVREFDGMILPNSIRGT